METEKCKKPNKKNFEGFKSLLEILKLRLDGNFRPKRHDFNNKNTSLKIELAAAKLTHDVSPRGWRSQHGKRSSGRNAPLLCRQACSLAACIMYNSLCKGISETPVISVKDRDCYATSLFPCQIDDKRVRRWQRNGNTPAV